MKCLQIFCTILTICLKAMNRFNLWWEVAGINPSCDNLPSRWFGVHLHRCHHAHPLDEHINCWQFYLGLNIRFAISEVKALHSPLSAWCKQSLIIHLSIILLQQFVATNEGNIQIETFDSVITTDFYHLAEARHKLLKSFEGHHTAGIWASQVPPVAI